MESEDCLRWNPSPKGESLESVLFSVLEREGRLLVTWRECAYHFAERLTGVIDCLPRSRIEILKVKVISALLIGLIVVGIAFLLPKEWSRQKGEDPSVEDLVILGVDDLDDQKKLQVIEAMAVEMGSLEWDDPDGFKIFYAKGEDVPFSGWAKTFHENGVIESLVSFNLGKRDGKFVAWRADGSRNFMATLSKGRLDGPKFSWDKKGNLEWKGNYRDGKQFGSFTEFYPNGNKAYEINIRNGVTMGPSASWFEDGSVSEQCTFKDGELEGEFRTWHANGKKHIESFYRNGKLEGVAREWNEKGLLVEEGEYRKGKRLESPADSE